MNNRHVYILAGVLVFIGLFTAFMRSSLTGIPFHPEAMADAWVLERQVDWVSEGGAVKLEIKMPESDERFDLIGEQVTAPRFGVVENTIDGNRTITLARRAADGPQTVYLRTALHRDHRKARRLAQPMVAPVVGVPELNERERAAAEDYLALAVSRSADDSTLVSVLLGMMQVDELEDNLLTLSGGRTDVKARADVAVSVLAMQGIAARRVNGIKLRNDPGEAQIVHWLEAFVDGRWQPFSIAGAAPGIPDTYAALWRGSGPQNSLTGDGRNLVTSMNLRRLNQRVLDQVLSGEDVVQKNLMRFSLYALPLEVQHVMSTMLVVPLGIIVLVLLRNVVGVKSLGTFMPVLIALALHSTYLTWGVPLFVGIIAAGLLFRLYLEHLKLLLVPRLAAVLIFVVMLLVALSMLTHALGLPQGLSVALFPMVIMTMTIERLSILWDERGASEAIKQGVSSILIAVGLCILISFEQIRYLFFTFPELTLILLAAALLLGRYTGYRLVELPRFREMAS